MLKSPFLERLEEEGLEVILFTDAIDEYMMQHLSEYDDRKLINISKDNLKLGGKDKDEKAADKALKVGSCSPSSNHCSIFAWQILILVMISHPACTPTGACSVLSWSGMAISWAAEKPAWAASPCPPPGRLHSQGLGTSAS